MRKKITKVIKSINLDIPVIKSIKILAEKENRNFSNFVNCLLSDHVAKQRKK